MKTAVMENHKLFNEAAHNAVIKCGWDPKTDLEIKTINEDNSSIFRYGYQASRVRLAYTPDLAGNLEQVIPVLNNKKYTLSKNYSFRSIVAGRVYMQVGSFKVCPSYTEDYSQILEASSDGLRSAGAEEPEVHDFSIPLTSFFIASIVSGVYGLTGPDPEQFRLGWTLDHICSTLPASTSLPSYVSIYANIQLRLWGNSDIPIDILRNSYSQPIDTLEFETDRGVAILLDTFDFAGTNQDGLAWVDAKIHDLIMDELRYNYKSWPIKAFQFAEIVLVQRELDKRFSVVTPVSI